MHDLISISAMLEEMCHFTNANSVNGFVRLVTVSVSCALCLKKCKHLKRVAETFKCNFTFFLKSRIVVLLRELQVLVYLFNKHVVEFGFYLQLLAITQLIK